MSQSKGIRVFILGAGCSAECGYPPGTGFATHLEDFVREIPNQCPTVKQSVTDTLNLLKELPRMETLDQLARHVDKKFRDWESAQGIVIADGKELSRRQALTDKQIRDAKIATSAMFLAKEPKARETGLPRYRQFITEVFGGPPCEIAVRETDCHVLTFNYDRLFEIAFLESFPDYDASRGFLYGKDALNSAFNPDFGCCSVVQPVPDRFCFLKLHGSAGWWAKRDNETGERRCWPSGPLKALSLVEIEKSIPKQRGVFGWEPLITFPHERQLSREFFKSNEKSIGYAWAPYTDAVWKHAADVVANATEVKVVGYSFNPIDSRYMVNELLNKTTCQKVVIQNKDVETVRKNLASYTQLRGRLEFDPTPF